MSHFSSKLALAALAAFGIAGAQFVPAAAQQPKIQTAKIRTDWVPNGIYSGLYYAQARGYYEREGLKVEVLPGNGSNATIDSVLRGDVDAGFVTCWATSIGISKGRDVISIATYTGKIGHSFFTPKEANVKTLADLAGKTISVTPSAFDTQFYPAVLTRNGLSAELMRRLNVDASQKVPTYTRGQADVVVSNLAYAGPLIQEQRPSNVLMWSSVGFVLPDYCIIASRERMEKDPQFFERLLRASYAGTAEAAKNPDDAAKAAMELNPLLNKAVTDNQWRLMSELFYTDDSKLCPHGWHSQKDWTMGLATLQKYGGLEGSIEDHSKFYTNRFFSCNR